MNPNYFTIIRELLLSVSNFSSNDLLVNVSGKHAIRINTTAFENNQLTFPLNDPQIKNLLKQSEQFRKEQGIFPLCLAEGFVSWEFRKTVVETPVWLIPCKIDLDKVNQLVRVSMDQEDSFLNPFIRYRLKNDFSIEVDESSKSREEITALLQEKGFETNTTDAHYLGNFHHHRYEVLKELEELLNAAPSEDLLELLGEEKTTYKPVMTLPSKNLLAVDPDQLSVFERFSKENCVVQGPPGTGKSQVLTNLIAKLIYAQQTCIVISEKRPALEVIERKFNALNLGDMTFVATSETISRDAINELKESWRLLEQMETENITNLQLSEQHMDQLQMQLDVINHDSLIGGVGYKAFEQLSKNRDLQLIPFVSDLPDLKSWTNIADKIKLIYQLELQEVLSTISLRQLANERFMHLDKEIRLLIDQLNELQNVLGLTTWFDFQQAMKKAAICQMHSQVSFQQFENLFEDKSKQQKKFLSLYKKYKQASIALEALEKEQVQWTKIPTSIEVEVLLTKIKKQSIWSKWVVKREWSNYSSLPFLHAQEILLKQQEYWELNERISQIKIEFCELGVQNFSVDVEYVYHQITSYNTHDREIWLSIPKDLRAQFADKNTALNNIYHQLKSLFHLSDETNLSALLTQFLNCHALILANYEALQNIPENAQKLLKTAESFDTFECYVLKSNWVKFISLYPQFNQFNPADLLEKCRAIEAEQKQEYLLFAKELRNQQVHRFKEYHRILATPAAKLSTENKALKETLKKGKAILVKEFSKKRNLLPLRSLFASEAKVWMQLLKPVWMSNPAQVAKCFPMEKELFDACLFDEASQIELHNALGSIQRSRRILVAGDEQQMGPSTYFKSKASEMPDVLHQASFYWKSVQLKHHYRSEHPALIQFSNKYFYKNELLTFPSYKSEQQALSFHFVENGLYHDGKNSIEAKQTAAKITQVINNENSLGIVAFSETQLQEIEHSLSPEVRLMLEERIEQGTAFFKALENVQGDECDHLIISLAYGKNEEGKFHMKFGPLNAQGGVKRLNVLFSRAKKKIDLFASVKHTDFKISANEAIEKLRFALLQFEESTENKQTLNFPLQLNPTIESNKLHVPAIHFNITHAQEMVTVVEVLENRGWEIIV